MHNRDLANPQVVLTKNAASLTMGIIAIVLGVLALLIGWIPLAGVMATPLIVIAILMAIIGIIIAACKKFVGWGMPVLGLIINLIALIIMGCVQSATADVISKEASKFESNLKKEASKVDAILEKESFERDNRMERHFNRLKKPLSPSKNF